MHSGLKSQARQKLRQDSNNIEWELRVLGFIYDIGGSGPNLSYKLMRTACTRMKDVLILVTDHQKSVDHRPNARRKNPYMALFLEIEKQGNFFPTTVNFANKWTDFEILDLEKKLRQQRLPAEHEHPESSQQAPVNQYPEPSGQAVIDHTAGTDNLW